MAVLYTAKEVNEGIKKGMEQDLCRLLEKGVLPRLATVRIGENAADVSYENAATKRLTSLGLVVENIRLPVEVPQELVIEKLEALGKDNNVHGILLFQPLPKSLDEAFIKASINPKKDVDCATDENLAAVFAGRRQCYPYCAPAAVMELIDHYGIELSGKHVVVIGRGLVVGRPLAMLLVDRSATVSICHTRTKDLPAFSRKADIIISAAGVIGLITEDFVREGQIVLDIGTSFKNGKLYGDVDMESVEPIVAAVTPTPGGISGITTTVLAKHVIHAAKNLSSCLEPKI